MRRSLWIILLFVAVAPWAHADSQSFVFTATPSVPGGISASGIVTAEYLGTNMGVPDYLATGMTGTIDGNTITGVLPQGSVGDLGGRDGLGIANTNFVYGPPVSFQVINSLGFSDSAGNYWLIIGVSSTFYYLEGFDTTNAMIPGADVDGDDPPYLVTLTPVTAPAPEPGAGLLALAGVGLLLVIRRWRTRSGLAQAS
jgi:MYXO-CTERM domain-containing protein